MAINCEIVKQLIAICIQTDEPVTLINIHKLGHIKLKFEIMVLRPNFPIKDEGGWQLFFFIGNKADERGILKKINIGNLRFQNILISSKMNKNVYH